MNSLLSRGENHQRGRWGRRSRNRPQFANNTDGVSQRIPAFAITPASTPSPQPPETPSSIAKPARSTTILPDMAEMEQVGRARDNSSSGSDDARTNSQLHSAGAYGVRFYEANAHLVEHDTVLDASAHAQAAYLERLANPEAFQMPESSPLDSHPDPLRSHPTDHGAENVLTGETFGNAPPYTPTRSISTGQAVNQPATAVDVLGDAEPYTPPRPIYAGQGVNQNITAVMAPEQPANLQGFGGILRRAHPTNPTRSVLETTSLLMMPVASFGTYPEIQANTQISLGIGGRHTYSPPVMLDSHANNPQQSRNLRAYVQRYAPHPPNAGTPADITARANELLNSERFKLYCKIAVNVASFVPMRPPPTDFVSLDVTPMHSWYESIVNSFELCFAERLYSRGAYPRTSDTGNQRNSTDDHAAFKELVRRHVTAIFGAYNINFDERPIGSTERLTIDTNAGTPLQAGIAAMVLKEVTEKPMEPPQENWKQGQYLHPFYAQHLRRFRAGVVRAVQDSQNDAWILDYAEELMRGINGYEEYYVRVWRENVIRGGHLLGRADGLMFTVGD